MEIKNRRNALHVLRRRGGAVEVLVLYQNHRDWRKRPRPAISSGTTNQRQRVRDKQHSRRRCGQHPRRRPRRISPAARGKHTRRRPRRISPAARATVTVKHHFPRFRTKSTMPVIAISGLICNQLAFDDSNFLANVREEKVLRREAATAG